jgi:NADPH:quinone reductase-like Zn-dependent oxidoreductase
MSKRAAIIGTVLRARSNKEKAEATSAFAKDVLPFLASSAIKPIVDSAFEMKDIRAAHERLESNRTFGKVVLLMN